MEPQRQAETRYRLILGIETTALAIAAFALSYAVGDILGMLFHYDATIWIIVALVAWFTVALAARLIRFGQIKGLKLTGRTIIGRALLRVALLLSCGILLAGWLTALATGSGLATVFIRATALLMVASFVVSVAGGATINSLLAVKRRRRHIAL